MINIQFVGRHCHGRLGLETSVIIIILQCGWVFPPDGLGERFQAYMYAAFFV